MARVCVKTGKRTAFGNTRSHSLRHTRRAYRVNIQKKRVFDPATGTFTTMKVSTAFLRTLAKRLQEGRRLDGKRPRRRNANRNKAKVAA